MENKMQMKIYKNEKTNNEDIFFTTSMRTDDDYSLFIYAKNAYLNSPHLTDKEKIAEIRSLKVALFRGLINDVGYQTIREFMLEKASECLNGNINKVAILENKKPQDKKLLSENASGNARMNAILNQIEVLDEANEVIKSIERKRRER